MSRRGCLLEPKVYIHATMRTLAEISKPLVGIIISRICANERGEDGPYYIKSAVILNKVDEKSYTLFSYNCIFSCSYLVTGT